MSKKEKIKIILIEIKKTYIYKNINSIYIYGSFLTKTYTKNSDIDLYIILKKEITIKDLLEIINIKKKLLKKNINLELNINDKNLIVLKKKNYWHNSRGLLFLEELKKMGQCIYGEDILSSIRYEKIDLDNEARKIILSLIYNIHKNLIKIKSDKKINTRDLKKIIKFSCYLVTIMLFIYKPNINFKKNNYYVLFDNYFNFKTKSIEIFKIKRKKDFKKLKEDQFFKYIFDFTKEIKHYIINNKN